MKEELLTTYDLFKFAPCLYQDIKHHVGMNIENLAKKYLINPH
jgi:hypothetical protein